MATQTLPTTDSTKLAAREQVLLRKEDDGGGRKSSSSEAADVSKQSLAVDAASRQRTKHYSSLFIRDHPDRSANTSRVRTALTALKHLNNLPPSTVQSFLDSYVIYYLDWADEEAMQATLGPDYALRAGNALRSYYSVLNHLCALGAVEKMYIPPALDLRVSLRDNQLLYEEGVARDLALHSGMKVLDLGCGRGRVAAHMARFSGCTVTGLNIDSDQLGQAREFTREKGLDNIFVEHDFNKLPLPFATESFDAFYQIQALSLCRDIPALFRELFRILRPGARLSLLDWVRLAYDASDPEQVALMARVKPLIGAVGTPTPQELEAALRAAGFAVIRSENASTATRGLQAPLIEKVDGYFRAGRRAVHGLVRARILRPHLRTLIDRLCLDGRAFVEMDRRGLITTSWSVVAVKPF